MSEVSYVNISLAIGSSIDAPISSIIPAMTRVAWDLKKD